MKQKTLKALKDGQVFKLSKRSKVKYKIITRNKRLGICTYTSLSSELSFKDKFMDIVCYVDK